MWCETFDLAITTKPSTSQSSGDSCKLLHFEYFSTRLIKNFTMIIQSWLELYIFDFSPGSPGIFIRPVFLSTPWFIFNFWKSSFSLNRVTLSRQRKTIQFFVILKQKTIRNYLATILIGKYRESFFTSSQMNPVLLMFPSWNQPSRLTDQTELQRVDTTRVSNSSPEWKWNFLKIRFTAKSFGSFLSFP